MLKHLALAIAATVALSSPALARDLTVHFLDVGQGDAFLIVSPTGKTVLVDAGPPDYADRFVMRLKQLTSRPLDLVILTHAHADHMGGMEKAVLALGARVCLDAGFDHPSPWYEQLLQTLGRLKVPLRVASPGRQIDLGGGATLTLLAPPQPFLTGTRSDTNSNSIVARLVYGKTAFYLASDSETATERSVLATTSDLQSDVYKVAHHGSAQASTPELLARIKPSIAIISVGAGNDYGHPTQETLDRLRDAGVKVYRTDLNGEITVRSNGVRLDVTASRAGPQVRAAAAAPVTAAASPAASGYLASRRSAVFHRPGCPGAADIKLSNLVRYATRDGAVAAGRKPAKDCNP